MAGSIKLRQHKRGHWIADIRIVIGTREIRRRLKSPYSAKGESKRWANEQAKDLEANGLPREREPEIEVPTLAAFVPEFMAACASPTAGRRGANSAGEIEGKRYALNLIKPVLGARRLDAITVGDVERFAAEKLAGYSTSYTANILQTLRRLLRLAGERYAFTPPRVSVPSKPGRVEYIQADDVAAFVAGHPRPEWRAFLLVAIRTGLRLGELRALRWRDVDSDARCLYVRRSIDSEGHAKAPKSGKPRRVPLAWDAVEALDTLPRSGDLVFPAKGGGVLDRQAPLRAVQTAARRSGVATVDDTGEPTDKAPGVHTCRHTFASHAVQAGVPIATVQAWLGHATITMTMKYAHLGPTHGDDQIDKLAPARPLRVVDAGTRLAPHTDADHHPTRNAPHGHVRGA